MYDKVDEIINNLSIKHRVSKNITTLAIDHVFKEIRNKIGDDSCPNVLIHNWGRFKPNIRYIEYKIKNLYKLIKEQGVKGDQFIRLEKYIKTYRRISKEEKIEFNNEFLEIEKYLKESNEKSN